MPKQKSKSGAKKRFHTTGTGKIVRQHACKRHNLRKRTKKQKLLLTHAALVHRADAPRVRRLLSC